ncbi:MAG: hypothetical protein ABIT37_11830 [Luteolibacter sp.]
MQNDSFSFRPIRIAWATATLLTGLCAGLTAAPLEPTITATKDDGVISGNKKLAGSTVTYTNTLTNTAGPDATGVQFKDPDITNAAYASNSLKATPVAFDDTYPDTVIANTSIDTATGGFSVLSNDFMGYAAGSAVTLANVKIASVTTPAHGTVSMTLQGAGVGRFIYTPAPGYTGSDSFSYVIDGVLAGGTLPNRTATVNLTVAGPVIWFVDPVAASGGTGALGKPFNSLASAVTAIGSSINHRIFVYSTATPLTTATTLNSGGWLVGQAAIGTNFETLMGGITYPPATTTARPVINNATKPSLTCSTGSTLTLGNSSVVLGVALGNTGGGYAVSGGNTVTTAQIGNASTVDVTIASSGSSSGGFSLNGGNGSITVNAPIATTGGHSVSIANRTGGTISFPKAVSDTGTGTGVLLTGNGGATIAFSGGLTLSTGGNSAFTATGGGTVTATQDNSAIINTIATTTATALNIVNTNIGASGLTFRSINSNGGTSNGIILDTTGASGGLTVTGDGSNLSLGGNSTGGTIQTKNGADGTNINGVGIYLNNTTNVVLRRMTLSGTIQNFGIRGFGVNGFTMEYCTVGGTFGTSTSGIGEGGVYFGDPLGATGVTGAAVVTNCSISGGRTDNFSVHNTSGTLNRMTITGSTFGLNQAGANDSLAFEVRNNATVNATVTGCTFTGAPGDLASFVGQINAAMDVVFQNNTCSNNHAGNNIGGGGLTFGGFTSTTINVSNNTIRDANGSAITLQLGAPLSGLATATSFSGTVNNNTIGVTGVTDSGSKSGNGIFFSFADNSTAPKGVVNLAITNNVIRRCSGNAGIFADNTGGNYDFMLTCTGNTVAEPGAGAFAGFALTAGGPSSTDDVDVFAKITGNDFSTGDPSNGNDIIVGVSAGLSSMKLAGTSGPADGVAFASLAAVQTFLLSNNNSAGTVVAAYTDSPATAANFLGAGATNPPLPSTLLFASGGIEAAPVVSANEPVVAAAVLQISAPSAVAPVVGKSHETPGTISQADLDAVVSSSIARWEATGLTAEQAKTLRSVQFEIAALPDARLGEAGGNLIRVDADAGGNGWFIAADEKSDAEFGAVKSDTRRYTASAGLPAGRVDLLTTVMHEMGHALGLSDTYNSQDRENIMFGQLTTGERRAPVRNQASGLAPFTGEVTHFLSGGLNPITIGTLPAGKSVVITYDVTIDSPFALGQTQLSSQATVSGTNFTQKLTNDPETGAADDATVTLLDRPDTTVISLARQSANPNKNGTVTWQIVFANPVAGLAISNFTLVNTNLGGSPAISSVTEASGPPATTWNITASTGTGDGSLGLNLANDTGLSHDVASLAYTGEIFTIDRTAPSVSSVVRVNANPSKATSVDFTVTFSESVTGVDTSDFTVTTTGTAAGTISGSSGSGAVYTVTVSSLIGDGTLGLNVNGSGTSIADSATNGLSAGFTGQAYTLDHTLPTVVMSSATGDPTTNAAIPVTVQFSETVTGFTLADITPSQATAGNFLALDGDTYTFDLTPNGPGVTATADIAAAAGQDSAGNDNTAATQFSRSIRPVVTLNTAALASNALTFTISGAGFSTTPGNNTIVLSNGSGTVTTSSGTELTVTGVTGLVPGNLTAVVTSSGISSGAPVQVATVVASVPAVINPTSSLVTAVSATLGGDVTSDAGFPITGRGVVYSPTATNGSPQLGGAGVTAVTTSGTVGLISVNASGLTPGRSYSFKAYATSSEGTGYSATGTFVTAISAGDLVISEFRLRGPSGANDEYVEIYNKRTTSITVQAQDGSAGFALVASNGVARFVIPNGTIVPAHGHYLGVNSVGYGLTAHAAGDVTFTSDIPDNAGIALFASSTTFTLGNRLDAVGSTTESATLYKEGTGYPALTPFSIDCAWYRLHVAAPDNNNLTVTLADGVPHDSDNNAADFKFVDTNGTSAGGGQLLGAPGPENLSSPIAGYYPSAPNIGQALVDPGVSHSASPNRIRDLTSAPATNSTFGTLVVNRTFTNNTGVPLSKLRFRIVKLTTFPSQSGFADLRPITSSDVVVSTTGGNVTVKGTTLEQPPSQPNGGGWNSSFAVPSVSAGTPLANGGSVTVGMRFGIQQTGNYCIALLVEGSPNASHFWYLTGDTESPAASAENFSGKIEQVSIAADAPSKAEGTGAGTTPFTFTVSRTGDTAGPVTVNYAVSGAAVNVADFGGSLPSGQVTIPDGSASTTLTVNVSKDSVVESDEAFTVTLSNPNNGYALDTATANSTIINDDFEADLSITATDGVTTAVPGNSVTYTITASNAGPHPAPSATVTDTFPASLTNVTWTAVGAGGGTVTASGSGNINGTVNLPVGGSVTYTVSATISSAATGTLSNTATVSSSIIDPVPGNNSATDSDTLAPQANLSITKTDGVTTATPGGSVTYTITASNAGPSNVTGATLADTLPASLTATWTAVGAGGGTATASGSGNINETVNLPAGGSVTFTVSATISPAATGTLSNTATIAAPGGVTDPTPGNNSATDSDTLAPQANLAITKTDGVTTAVPGNTVTYTITASNAGPSNAPGATVADTFPASLTGTWTAVGAGGGTATASGSGNINDTVNLPAGGSVTYTVTTTISALATGTLSNTATVTAPAGVTDSTPGNNSATDSDTLAPQANLSITKTDGVTTATPGGSVTYTITASNAGPSGVTGATVADTLPAALSGATWTATGAGGGTATASGSGNINDSVNLPVGGSVTYTVSAPISAAATGTLSNTATITAPAGVTDSTPGDNSATDSDTLSPQANLAITKTDGVTTAVPGASVTYTITATNAGPSNATGATVADTFPASLTGTWTAVGAGGGTATASGSGNINDTVNLPVGGSVTYTVTTTISASATGTLSNTATVTAPAGVTDPTPGNNSATDSDTLAPQANLAITKTDGVTTAIPGASVTYTITASNSGPSNSPGATVADTLPGILSGATWSALGAGGGTATASGSGNINDTVNLPAGGSVTYTVSATVSASATGTLSNTATVSAPGGITDSTPGNNRATDTDTLVPTSDLAITKTDGVVNAIPGNSVTYTITASNAGPSTATGATVADTLPAIISGATWTAVGAGGGTATASGSGNISDTVNLPVGGSVTYTVTAPISAAATGTLSNTATVSAPGGVTDPTPGNNSATDTDTLTPRADLSITKTDGVVNAVPGNSVTYTITASNAGPSAASGATVADTLPAVISGATWTAIGAGGGTATASGSGNISDTVNLPVGGSVTYTVTAPISAAATGTLSNTATVSPPAGVTDPTPGNNSATDTDTLTPQADLAITKTDGVTSAVPGTSVTYTITASNAGPSAASGTTVTDTLPAIISGASWTAVGAGGGTATASGSGNINDTVNLPAGGSVTYTVTAPISSAATGTLSNTATVSSSVTDPTPGNNSATDTDTLKISTDLSITLTDGVSTAIPGTSVTYTITATNYGPSDSRGAVIYDPFPESISGVTWTAVSTGGGTVSTGGGTPTASGSGNIFNMVNLPIGASVTYTVTAPIIASATGSLINAVGISVPSSTPDADPSPGNNIASDSDTLTPQADLAVTITDSPDPVNALGEITYTITVKNQGLSAAVMPSLSLPLDSSTTYVSAGHLGDWPVFAPDVGTNGTVTFSTLLNTILDPGVSVTFTVVAKVDLTVINGSILSATATVSSATSDPVPGNNSATATTTAKSGADLQITLTDAPDPVIAGTELTYSIQVQNNGPLDADNVSITDSLPAGTTFVSVGLPSGWSATTPAVGANGMVTITRPLFANAASATITLVAKVNSNIASGTNLSDTAAINSTTIDIAPGNNSATATTAVAIQSDLVVDLTVTPTTAPKGSNVTYTITLTNNGPSDAAAPYMYLPIPSQMTFVSVTKPAGWTSSAPPVGGGGTVDFSATSLDNGATASFTVVAKVKTNAVNGAVMTTTAAASSTGVDPVLGNNTDSATAAVGTTTIAPVQPVTTGIVATGQTGLFDVVVNVTNTTPLPINGFRLHVDYSAYKAAYPSLRLYNASSGPSASDVYIDYPFPMSVDALVAVKLSFYTSTRTFPSPFKPKLTVEILPTSQVASTNGAGIQPRLVMLANKNVMLEFPSKVGRWYRMRFSSDMIHWQDSPVPLQAGSTRMQWIDSGPPFTDVPPAQAPSRFYRVNEIAAP